MTPLNPSFPAVRFTVADFNRLGGHNGFRYQLPGFQAASADPDTVCIAEGRVEEHAIRPGLTLVMSDVLVHHHYESTSVMTPRFSAIVMLQGQAQARVGHHDDLPLVAQSGISAAYGDTVAMTGIHHAGQRLRSVNLSLSEPDAADDDPISDRIRKVLRTPAFRLRRWQVQAHLMQSIEHLLECRWDDPLCAMLREGVGAQLLAHALAALDQQEPEPGTLSQRDRQLLERVRERLHSAPGEEHTLDDLAKLACMSPSTLRAKFRAAYQCSVFSWLRERRLEVAREQLARGCSVQQAAHCVGYRHATNFATAFRERYGVAPSELN
ncbi:helix-turn-helix transcriptional regulator [Achromobacter aegrifaciens]|uniref:helix-turn-helix transcriptional regulator n=1 Tax=Achromobacter aegrifaciens TaxID=1287736 RepID=UPI001581DBA6